MNAARCHHSRRAAAFTMVELALCIAIIAFAMVAIIGVLPAGLGVQRQNREETIIDQDASVLLEAIRNGAVGFDDLTNYVDYIVVARNRFGDGSQKTNGFKGPFYDLVPGASPGPAPWSTLGYPEQVVGLLSLPRIDYLPTRTNANRLTNQNYVTAQFRAFSGALNEKVLPQTAGAQPSPAQLSEAFRYLLTVDLVPLAARPTNHMDRLAIFQQQIMEDTLYDLKLTFQWPVFGKEIPAQVGGNQKVYRTQVQGQMAGVANRLLSRTNLYAPGADIRLRRFIPEAAAPSAALSNL